MDWNQAYLDENTPWDKGMPSPVLVELLGDIPINAKMVVPGCGTGNDIVALLDANPASVIGIDIAPKAIALLRIRFDGNPVVHPVLGDFVQHAAEHPASADVVIEHTCFCAIPVAMRPAYAVACLNILRPGGKVIGVFYWMPRDTDDITIGPPFQTSEAELCGLFGPEFDLDIRVANVGFPERLGREFRVVMTRRPFVNDEGTQGSV
jgi:SAM-dependent methyltransferase